MILIQLLKADNSALDLKRALQKQNREERQRRRGGKAHRIGAQRLLMGFGALTVNAKLLEEPRDAHRGLAWLTHQALTGPDGAVFREAFTRAGADAVPQYTECPYAKGDDSHAECRRTWWTQFFAAADAWSDVGFQASDGGAVWGAMVLAASRLQGDNGDAVRRVFMQAGSE